MSIETLTTRIISTIATFGDPVSPPASSSEIDRLSTDFQKRYGVPLPDSYKQLLRVTNGLIFAGLTVWPTSKQTQISESLIDANDDLRLTLDDRFLYFGQLDEELYVLEISTGLYCAIELAGRPIWKTFKNDQDMMEFMLSRTLDLDTPDEQQT
jgi:hypothetical protein